MNRDFNSVISILVSYNVDHDIIDDVNTYLEQKSNNYVHILDVLDLIDSRYKVFVNDEIVFTGDWREGVLSELSILRERVLALKGGES